MDIIQQNRTLWRLVLGLAVVNLSILGLVLYKQLQAQHPQSAVTATVQEQPAPQESVQLSDVLKDELQLSQEQCQNIDRLRSEYRVKERDLAAQIRQERDSMNASMFHAQTDDALVRSLARRVADNEFAMEMLRYEQAQAFKQLCTAEQAQKFEELMKDIRDYFRPSSRNDKRGQPRPDDRPRDDSDRPPKHRAR